MALTRAEFLKKWVEAWAKCFAGTYLQIVPKRKKKLILKDANP
jgi:hypothetical protein